MKILLFALSIGLVPCLIAQSPKPFKGGAGDGRAKGNMEQSSVEIWHGGFGDGLDKAAYVQMNSNFWTGGDGDGNSIMGFMQQSTPFWLGGAGDGFAISGFLQPTLPFWLGGGGDGNAQNSYLQPTTAFWLGGRGDGHTDSGYVQQSISFWLGGAGDGWASSYLPERPLPVRFGVFTAEKKSESEALLKWKTLSESNSSHFDIERSIDAVNFYKIGVVNAAGFATTSKYYSFLDLKVLGGNNYYRLKQVDTDGKFVFTPTRMVSFKSIESAVTRIFPNPASAYVTIEWAVGVSIENTVVNMVDMKGNMVKQWKIPVGSNVPSKLSVQGLPNGTYIIHIINGKNNSFQKLLIQ